MSWRLSVPNTALEYSDISERTHELPGLPVYGARLLLVILFRFECFNKILCTDRLKSPTKFECTINCGKYLIQRLIVDDTKISVTRSS